MSDFFVKTEAKRWLMIMSHVGNLDTARSMADDLRKEMAGAGMPAEPSKSGYAMIAAAAGMPGKFAGQRPWSLDEIIDHIKKHGEVAARLQGSLRDFENAAKQDGISLTFFRESFKQMKEALYEGADGVGDSALVAEVIEASKQRMADLRDIEKALGSMPVKGITVDMLIGRINDMRAEHRLGLRKIKEALGTPRFAITGENSQPDKLVSQIRELHEGNKRRVDVSVERFNALEDLQKAMGTATHREAIDKAIAALGDLIALKDAAGFYGTDGLPTMCSVMEYRKGIAAHVDKMTPDNEEPLVYLDKLEGAAEKLSRVKRHLMAMSHNTKEEYALRDALLELIK